MVMNKSLRSTIIILFSLMLGLFAVSELAKSQACKFQLESSSACHFSTYVCAEVICAAKFGGDTPYKCSHGDCYCCVENLKMVTN